MYSVIVTTSTGAEWEGQFLSYSVVSSEGEVMADFYCVGEKGAVDANNYARMLNSGLRRRIKWTAPIKWDDDGAHANNCRCDSCK